MKRNTLLDLLLLTSCVVGLLAGAGLAQTTEPVFSGKIQTTPIPAEYKDPETGLRIVHLSRFRSDYGSVIYFTYNTFSADSGVALINAQYKDKWRQLYTFDFGSMTVSALVTNRLTQNQVVVAKSGHVYYQADHAVWVVPLKGGTPRKLCDLPVRWFPGTGFTVNADETLLLGGSADPEPSETAKPGAKASRSDPNVIFTVSLKTGELKIIHRDNYWFGHAQFSPTDPDLAMFCHEGNWEMVDRIWFINPSKSSMNAAGKVTSNARIAYHRAEPGEIVGHEFWHPDGKTIWFQQSYRKGPRRGTGYLTSMEVATGRITQYTVPDGFGGIHETFSPDGTFMVADGNGKGKTGPGKYISKLTIPVDGSTVLKGEHLVSLQVHDYVVEPNPHISPDNRWVMFTAMLHGTPQAYAVELRGNGVTSHSERTGPR